MMLALTIPSQVPWIVTFIMFLVGGGGAISWFRLKAENARVMAGVKSSGTEDEVKITKTIQDRYDKLFDDLQIELAQVRASDRECKISLQRVIESLAETRVELATAQAEMKELRRRFKEVEVVVESQDQTIKSTVSEIMRQMGLPVKEGQ